MAPTDASTRQKKTTHAKKRQHTTNNAKQRHLAPSSSLPWCSELAQLFEGQNR
jgi:hypothetical protein